MEPLFSATISSGRSGRLPPLRADERNGGGVLRRCKATGVRAAHLLPLGRNGARQRHSLDRRPSPLGEQGRHDLLWLDATAAAMGGGVTGVFDGIPISKSATTVGGKLLTLFSLGFTFPWECDGSASLFRQCSGDVGRCRGWKESLDDAPFLLLDQRRCSLWVQVTVRPADCFDGIPSPVQRRKHATAATPAVAVAPPSGAA
nr:hypothetical protein Itr_chr08CG12840 [Ipomoea trifida]